MSDDVTPASADPSRQCNPVQPGATPCNPTQPRDEKRKTNPTPRSAAHPTPAERSAVAWATRSASPVTADLLAAACNRVQPSATPCNVVQPDSQMRKTNPPHAAAATELSDRQRAAARLLATGRSIPDVARELGLDRSTVWRWRRSTSFVAELDRQHQQLTAASAPRRLPSKPATDPPLSKFARRLLGEGGHSF